MRVSSRILGEDELFSIDFLNIGVVASEPLSTDLSLIDLSFALRRPIREF